MNKEINEEIKYKWINKSAITEERKGSGERITEINEKE